MALLDHDALEEIALGATVLGTGGGGDPKLGKLMAQQAVTRHGPVQLLPLDEVPDDEWIIPTAMMGAPTVLVEKIPSGTEVLDAFRMLERRLCEGKITDVRRRTERGFARGELDLVGTGRDVGAQCKISFQNENLVFWRDGQPEVTVPDLITIVDEQTGLPITTESLKYGLRVVVLGIPCHPQWRTPGGLALAGPHYFGYEIEYVPLQ